MPKEVGLQKTRNMKYLKKTLDKRVRTILGLLHDEVTRGEKPSKTSRKTLIYTRKKRNDRFVVANMMSLYSQNAK